MSGPGLGFVKRIFGVTGNDFEGTELEKYLVPAEKAVEILSKLGKEVIPVSKYDYIRKIGGQEIIKVMFGVNKY